VVDVSSRSVVASVHAFALFHLQHSGCVGHRPTDALSPLSLLVDALSRFYSGGCFTAAVVFVGDCFGRILCHHILSVGWMLCHLCCVVDLCTLDIVVSFASSFVYSCLGLRVFVSLLHCCSCFLVCYWGRLSLAWWCSISILIASDY